MKKLYFLAVGAYIMTFSLMSCGGKGQTTVTNPGEATEDVVDVDGAKDVMPENTLDNDVFKVVDHMIISDKMPVVVDFNATGCGPCKQYKPVFDEVAGRFEGQVCFVGIDIDVYPEIAKAYNVQAVPTTVFIMPGGGVMGSESGAIDEQTLASFVDQLLATSAGYSGSI